MPDSKMKNMKMLAVVGLIFSSFYFGSGSLHAQNKAGKYKVADEGIFFAKRYFSVSLLPLVIASKASLKGDTKKYSLKSAPQLSFEALINYHYDFEKNYSLIFGLGGGVIGHNFDYVIPKEMFDPQTSSDITSNTAASREKELFYIIIVRLKSGLKIV